MTGPHSYNAWYGDAHGMANPLQCQKPHKNKAGHVRNIEGDMRTERARLGGQERRRSEESEIVTRKGRDKGTNSGDSPACTPCQAFHTNRHDRRKKGAMPIAAPHAKLSHVRG